MLCLSDSIRDNDPSVQRFLSAVEEARTLTALILAAWPFTRGLVIHIVEVVLAERARCPSSWPRCPRCGVPLQRIFPPDFGERRTMSRGYVPSCPLL
jgi:hypothetical protein